MRGTDVHCYYQRSLDWNQVTAKDIGFVWEKVSDGTSPYTKTVERITYRAGVHIKAAKARGIPTGGYHYAQFGDPNAQADLLVRECRRLGAVQVAPMLDLEAPFVPNLVAKNFAIAFCKRVLASGFSKVAVYMSSGMARVLRPDQWGIAGLVIVIARYGAVPEHVGSNIGSTYTGHYDVHQYASNGSLGGITVDLDDARNNSLLLSQLLEDDMTVDELLDYVLETWGGEERKIRDLLRDIQGRGADNRIALYGPDDSNKIAKLQTDVDTLVTRLNNFSEQLAEVFTTVNAQLTDIQTKVGSEVTFADVPLTGTLHIGPSTT